jgi:hypothetical protein
MATYAVSFTIKWNDTYNERYDSFMEQIRKCKTVWTETTSFALVETDEKIVDFEFRLWLSKFNSTTDSLLVIDASYDDATIRGPAGNRATLKKLLPGIKEK